MSAARASLVALGLISLSGCGSSTPPTPLTPSELVSQAGAICQRAADSERAVAGGPESLPARLGRLAQIGDAEVKALRSLRPPVAESSDYDAFLAQGSRLVGLVQRLSRAGDPLAADQMLAEGREEVLQLETLERPLGLSACSIPTS